MYIRALPRVFLGKAVHAGKAVDGVVHAPVAQVGHIVAVCFDELATVELVRLQARTVALLVFPRQAAGIVAGALHGQCNAVRGFPHLADIAQVVAAVTSLTNHHNNMGLSILSVPLAYDILHLTYPNKIDPYK